MVRILRLTKLTLPHAICDSGFASVEEENQLKRTSVSSGAELCRSLRAADRPPSRHTSVLRVGDPAA